MSASNVRQSASGVPLTTERHIDRVSTILREEALAYIADPLDAATALFDAAATVLSSSYAPTTVAAMLKAIATIASDNVSAGSSKEA